MIIIARNVWYELDETRDMLVIYHVWCPVSFNELLIEVGVIGLSWIGNILDFSFFR